MRILNRISWCAAGLAAGWLAVHAAAADETAVDDIAEAILENPDCAGAAIANEAINEGLRRGGRRLLSRLGVNAPQRAAAPVPCESATAAAAAAPVPAEARAQAAQPAQAASTASRAATNAAARAPAAEPEPERRTGPFSRLRQAATTPSTNQRGRNCGALGTTCANGLDALVACVNEISFWSEMAVAVERKRDSSPNLTAQQRKEIEEDLAAMRKAHETQSSRVEPVDPARPNRHLDWLTPEEYSVAATAAAQKINAHKQECDRKHVRF